MYEILALGYEFLAEFVPFFLMLMLLRRKRGRFAPPFTKGHYVLPVVFALYVMAVLYITNPGSLYDAVTVKPEHMADRINLIPFSNEIDWVGYGLNVVMFVPFGFLLPLIWKNLGRLPRVAAAGLGFSTIIEVGQLFSFRGTDVDDLLMNTLGAVIGLLIYKLWDRLTGSRYQLEGLKAGELAAYLLAIFGGRFFLFYRLGLIRLFYGG